MIGIIGFNSLHVMQYLYKYTDILDAQGIPYEVVYWDRTRDGEAHPFGARAHVYHLPTNTAMPFHKKILSFVRYTAFMRSVIRRQKYDKLIVLTSQTAVALSGMLTGAYKGRYIYDFRDLTKERSAGYLKRVVRLINESAFTAISSPGFVPTLKGCDTGKLVLSHNFRAMREIAPVMRMRSTAQKLRLSFWGIIRQLDYQKRLCDLFGNDPRFDVCYHGTGVNEELCAYCVKMGYRNITFTGRYTADDVAGFAERTDILLNTYENDFEQKPAISVKLLDGMRFRLPMLVTQDCYMAEFLKDYPVYLDIDPGAVGEADRICAWYSQLDMRALRDAYARLHDSIMQSERAFEDAVRRFGGN